MNLSDFIEFSVKHNASDLHLCTDKSPILRIDGEMKPIESLFTEQTSSCDTAPSNTFSANLLLEELYQLISDEEQQKLQHDRQLDFAAQITSKFRVRANWFYQNGGASAALRILPSTCPALGDLHLPASAATLLTKQDGIILITGATGSGKSTTLAAMIDAINTSNATHIVTLEDPIELIHQNKKALIQQREIGRDCHSFNDGLRAALRQDPDVLLLGELRDQTSIRLALTAAETGHLVFATLHTRTAAQAVDRLIDVFPAEEKNYIRSQLANSLQGVIAQRLVSKINGGRIGLYEVLLNTHAISNLIREGKTHQLTSIMQTGTQFGMQTFEQSEQQRRQQGLIV